MKPTTRTILVMALTTAIITATASADDCGDGVKVCECGDTVIADHTMTADLTNCGFRGLIVAADDVTLNCAGHVIDGSYISLAYGIYVDHTTGVTITDCYVAEFDFGIGVNTCAGTRLTGNSIHDVVRRGIYLSGSSTTEVSDNRVLHTQSFEGIYLSNSSNNTFWHNQVSDTYLDNAKEAGSSTNNSWDLNSVGNYWDDYSGSGSYAIPGGGGGIDHRPNLGDTDVDGDVDLADHVVLQHCLAGPEVTTPPSPECVAEDFTAADLEGNDGDVDLGDYGEFQSYFATFQEIGTQ